jgi:hypothetical protein
VHLALRPYPVDIGFTIMEGMIKIMNTKILPVTYPPITTFHGYADVLAILCNYENTYDWVYTNYLQIYACESVNRGKDDPQCHVFFIDRDTRKYGNFFYNGNIFRQEGCPFLLFSEIPIELIPILGNTFVGFIKECVDRSNYVYTFVDVARIREFNLDHSKLHDIFIYGYDDEEGVIYFAEFLNNDIQKYNFSKCTYKEAEEAFQYGPRTEAPFTKLIALMQYVGDNRQFKYNGNYIRETVSDYINPDKNTERRFGEFLSTLIVSNWEMRAFIGVDVYEYLDAFYKKELALEKDGVDHRLYHAMCEHKQMMIKRIEYFCSKGYMSSEKLKFLPEYEEVSKSCFQVRNLILKYNISKSRKILDKVPLILETTKSREIKLLKEIFDI